MSDILSQTEIDALLTSLQNGGEAGNTPTPSRAETARQGKDVFGQFEQLINSGKKPALNQAVTYEVYDFRRPDKFSKDQLRTLQMIHETFARLAGTALSAYLRTAVTIDLVSLEQVPYEEYLRSINTSVFTIVSMPPLSGQSVVEMEFALVFSMLDKLLGGPGRGINRNILTDIEKPLVRQMIERMFASLKTAWEGIVLLNPGIDQMETSAQFVQIAPPNDIVVTILFEVKVGNSRGAMSICIPYLVLKPITNKLSAQKWFVNNSRKHNPLSRKMLSWQLTLSEVECAVELGRSRLSIQDFLGLNVGDVLTLDTKTSDEFLFNVAGTPKYALTPAQRGKNLVFSITDTVENL